MTSSKPEAFNRAIEQIRDGKLDSMLSQMFGSEATSEAGVRRVQPWQRIGIEDEIRRNVGDREQ